MNKKDLIKVLSATAVAILLMVGFLIAVSSSIQRTDVVVPEPTHQEVKKTKSTLKKQIENEAIQRIPDTSSLHRDIRDLEWD